MPTRASGLGRPGIPPVQGVGRGERPSSSEGKRSARREAGEQRGYAIRAVDILFELQREPAQVPREQGILVPPGTLLQRRGESQDQSQVKRPVSHGCRVDNMGGRPEEQEMIRLHVSRRREVLILSRIRNNPNAGSIGPKGSSS